MQIREFLASGVVYCFSKSAVNFLFAILLFFLGESPFIFLAIGLLALSSSLLGFIRGIAKADVWGPNLMDVFPALFYLISGILLCIGKSPTEEIVYLSLTCFFMLEAFIGVMMANDVKYYFKFWTISLVGVFFALFLSFINVPGYYFSLIPVQPLLLLFLITQGILLFRIAFIERKLEKEYKKTVQEIQNGERN